MPKGYCKLANCDSFTGNEQCLVYPVSKPYSRNEGNPSQSGRRRLERRRQWLVACGLDPNEPNEDFVICGKHFVSGKPAPVGEEDDVDWVPSLNLPQDLSAVQDAAPVNLEEQGTECADKSVSMEGLSDEKPSLEEMSGEALIEEVQKLRAEKARLAEENAQLQGRSADLETMLEKLEETLAVVDEDRQSSAKIIEDLRSSLQKTQISEDFFRGADTRTKYFTGLPTCEVMMTMFSHVKDFIKSSPRMSLSSFQQFILTLMKLRFNLDFYFLGFFFNVSVQTASKVFTAVIHVMYVRYEPLLAWPSRENLHSSMPLNFREAFGHNVAVIIDCFEVFMERPSNMLAAAQVFSNYKKHCTVKYLIGISPQGAIVFLSAGYGGRASDKFITENSGFLKHLLPQDIVLADRGFTVHDLVRMQHAEIHMPHFKDRNSLQMSPRNVEESRKVSNLRIHVERVIGALKSRFKIWSSRLPTHFFHGNSEEVPLVDKMMRVTCALSNACPTVVSIF